MRDWEEKFRNWSAPPSQSEADRCERIIAEIKAAIDASPALRARSTRVFVQGSYRNNTNVRRDSDVDVGVVCFDTFFYDLPAGYTASNFGINPSTYSYVAFKDDVGAALRSRFGAAAVTRGNKAFDIKAGVSSGRIEADVAPFFPYRQFSTGRPPVEGVKLLPDNGIPPEVINWPEQHHANGTAKNNATNYAYKRVVRILKSLRNEMMDSGYAEAQPIIGFLNECLAYNLPNYCFAHQTLFEDVHSVVAHLITSTSDSGDANSWLEVNGMKPLFSMSQRWTRKQAYDFLLAAWRHVGFK